MKTRILLKKLSISLPTFLRCHGSDRFSELKFRCPKQFLNVLSFFRLVKAFTELDDYLKNELELNETKEYQAASTVLSEAKEQMDNSP